MTPILLRAPQTEPISLAEIKSYLRIEAEEGSDDGLLHALIAAARLTVEAASGRILLSQGWRLVLDRWPFANVIRLPLAPLIACEAIRVFSADGEATVLPASAYWLDAQGEPGRIVLNERPPRPGRALGGIEIDVTVGYGAAAADVPETLRQAVRMLVAHWYENRGDASDGPSGPPLPPDVVALVAPFRQARL